MKRVLLICPNKSDATSWWRGAGVWNLLRSDKFQVDLSSGSFDWPDLMQYSAVILQRPDSEQHSRLVKLCSFLKIPTIVDYDDDLFNVPISNPSFAHYNQPVVRQAIQGIAENCSIIIVSTEAISTSLGQPQKTIVIPNAWNDISIGIKEAGPDEKKKVIFWRGSPTHDEDLMSHKDILVKIKQNNPDYKWVFIGSPGWQILKYLGDDVKVYNPVDMINYVSIIRNLKPEFVVCPLANSRFNEAKSNIAWLEATFSGAACLATKSLPEWQKPGILDFYQDIAEDGKLPQNHHDNYLESLKFVKENLLLSEINKQRKEILEALL